MSLTFADLEGRLTIGRLVRFGTLEAYEVRPVCPDDDVVAVTVALHGDPRMAAGAVAGWYWRNWYWQGEVRGPYESLGEAKRAGGIG